MPDYKITCCSTADIPAERLNSLDIPFANYHYTIDGVNYYDDLYVSETPEEFYAKIDAGALPTTTPITARELCDMFEPILQQGLDILHIEFSSGLSEGWKSAQEARELMLAKYPDRKVYVVDSLAASSGYGMLVEMAADYHKRGMPIDELRHWLDENKLNIRHWFCSQNLMHFRRGGRISVATALVGTIFKVCPVMEVNDEGRLVLQSKPLGKKKALKTICSYMKSQALDGTRYNEKCYICHSMMEEDALLLKSMVEADFPKLKGKVEIFPIGTVIGSHSGPGTVALFFYSENKRTR